ncbi:MAG: leucine-rich repeat domain-containing protein [Porphyromonadaceae bacterium]|nr:leucine-rich repeat domain-containing protein [Porphyromonadaceae bacterium]
MKILFLASLLFGAQFSLWAYDFSSGGFYYNKLESGGVSVTYKTTAYNSYSGSIIVPETVTYNGAVYRVTGIGSSAFRDCTELMDVTLPNSIISIGDYAFYNCSNLSEITIPDNVTEIGNYAFFSCTALTEVTLGHSVASIGNAAFFGDKKLEGIYTKNTTPPTIYNSLTFNGVDKSACTLYVPTGCKSLYTQATYWKDFYNISEVEYPVESDGMGDIFTDATNEELVISLEAGAIVVQGENLPVAIYDLTGRLLRQETVQQEKRIELPAGYYIVKAGNTTQKILLGN